MPAVLSPSAPADAGPADPVSLSYEDSAQFDGGIRMVLPGRASPAPEFSLRGADGNLYTTESLRGRVVWIDLWAVWCATCRAEFPAIQRVHERYVDDGLTVLAICRNSTREGFKEASDKPWLSFPVVDASDVRRFSIPYGAFPTSLILDRQGRVRAYWQGHRQIPAVERLLRKLLAEPAPSPEVLSDDRRPLASGDRPSLETSSSVVTGELFLPRKSVTPGEVFEGRMVLDLDPGWHITADRSEDSIPLDVQLDSGAGIAAIDFLRPRTQRLTLAGMSREVYSGRVEFPLWGVIGQDAPDRPIEVRLAATVQACDSSKCLLPAEIVLSGEVPVATP
jgi:thiol-disulfide isomerase/thioredoxin